MTILRNNLITVVVVYVLILCVEKIFKYIFEKKGKKDINLIFIKQTIKTILIIIGIITMASQFKLVRDFLGTILMSSSLIVAVLAFAAQESLGNVISGMFISLFKPFDIGDRIKLVNQNLVGVVESITLRHTTLRTFENNVILIPNSVMNKEMIENVNTENDICNFMEIQISYESNLGKAKDVLKNIIENSPTFLKEKEIKILVKDLSESGVLLRIPIWTKTIGENFQLCSNIREQILTEFPKNHIEIPYPHIKIVKEKE